MTGYSSNPLAKKLGMSGMKVCRVSAPVDYRKLVEPLPHGVTISKRPSASTDMVHMFVRSKAELADALKKLDPPRRGRRLHGLIVSKRPTGAPFTVDTPGYYFVPCHDRRPGVLASAAADDTP